MIGRYIHVKATDRVAVYSYVILQNSKRFEYEQKAEKILIEEF